ncbi:hypothetical protein H6F71_04585 [Microcoleus sp. FACHB-61]|uniref:hypothetical protein n=1 Tax=Microcoleus vaginatus TaxID=119532 RepID=UPI00168616B6|nr:hypothetical protein [Microcoleus sp. FACHB-61]
MSSNSRLEAAISFIGLGIGNWELGISNISIALLVLRGVQSWIASNVYITTNKRRLCRET